MLEPLGDESPECKGDDEMDTQKTQERLLGVGKDVVSASHVHYTQTRTPPAPEW